MLFNALVRIKHARKRQASSVKQESFALVTADTEQTLAITGIPLWVLYLIPLVAFSSATLQALFNIVYAPEENLVPVEEPSDVELEEQL